MAQRRKMTRREFVRDAAQYAIYLAALSSGCASLKSLGKRRGIASGRDEYEYIVIGSGAGGGPVAANLAKAGKRVLLIEAGGNTAGRMYDVPAFHGLAAEAPEMTWQFFVNHYANPGRQARDSKLVPGKGVLYPRAATLGGCTAHNAMFTLYPDNQDWDDLAALTGDSSYGSDGMRTYFERLEKNHYLSPGDPGSDRHGWNGWLGTEQSDVRIAFKDRRLLTLVLEAAKEEGVFTEIVERGLLENNFTIDPNNWEYVKAKTDGFFNIPKSTYFGRRNGTRELILGALDRYPDQLTLGTGCLVTKLLFDNVRRNRVIGVEYMQGEHLYRADPNGPQNFDPVVMPQVAFAKTEVILAGGAFNSPQLLMLSGIGDSTALRAKGIEPRVHLPGVGRNLQDRYEVGVVSQLDGDLEAIKNCTFGADGDPCLADFDRDAPNSIYNTNGVVIAILKRSSSRKRSPDLAIFGVPGRFKGYYPGYGRDALRKDCFTWAILKGHTRNTAGTVSLRTADPFDTPDINFNYFEEGNDALGDDLESVLQGIKTVRKINARPLAWLVNKKELVPGKDVSTDEQLRQFVKNEAWGHHASCTNKMGPASDPLAVVDSKFRVHQTEGLRIVDASVFPKIPGLFIVVPVYMMAEKASDEILRG